MLRDDVGRLVELHRGLVLPFGSDDLRATLALGLGFLCHCALHIVGKYNAFDLDRGYLRTPRLRVPIAQSAWPTGSLSNSCWSACFPARLAVTMVSK
jgi:hypothetical protein